MELKEGGLQSRARPSVWAKVAELDREVAVQVTATLCCGPQPSVLEEETG